MPDPGFLVVWSDVQPSLDTDYLHWFTREHALERVSTPGFLAVRLFRAALPGASRYLIIYDLESPEVLTSPAYVAKLNSPTPWTQRTFKTLANFMRAGGRIAHTAGTGQGGTVTALTLPGELPADGAGLVQALARGERIARVRLYETDTQRTAVKTREKDVRGGDDRSFAGLLLIEGIDEAAVAAATKRLEGLAPQLVRDSTVGARLYGQVFGLERRAL